MDGKEQKDQSERVKYTEDRGDSPPPEPCITMVWRLLMILGCSGLRVMSRKGTRKRNGGVDCSLHWVQAATLSPSLNVALVNTRQETDQVMEDVHMETPPASTNVSTDLPSRPQQSEPTAEDTSKANDIRSSLGKSTVTDFGAYRDILEEHVCNHRGSANATMV